MAQLPPGDDNDWLIQQNNGIVTLFERYTERELLRFDPANADETAQAQKTIYDLKELNPAQKCFAHFWCGYFYAYATMNMKVV
jgi:hypothetical protein